MKQTDCRISRVAPGIPLTRVALAIGFGWMALVPASTPAMASAIGQEPAGQAQPATTQAQTPTAAPDADQTPDQTKDKGKRKKLDKPEEVDPLKRPLSDKQRFSRQK